MIERRIVESGVMGGKEKSDTPRKKSSPSRKQRNRSVYVVTYGHMHLSQLAVQVDDCIIGLWMHKGYLGVPASRGCLGVLVLELSTRF